MHPNGYILISEFAHMKKKQYLCSQFDENTSIMKKFTLFVLAIMAMVCTSCTLIPYESVFEKLTIRKLACAMKLEPRFAAFYEQLQNSVDSCVASDTLKAKYAAVSYRRYFKYYEQCADSAHWQALQAQWSRAWDSIYAKDLALVDDTMAFWWEYRQMHQLDNYAQVKLSSFYLTYRGNKVNDAFIGFTVTPLMGEIDYIKFSYAYGTPKDTAYLWHECAYPSSIKKPKESLWEVPAEEKQRFHTMTVKKFLQQYQLQFRIEEVGKNGEKISIDDNIPAPVLALWQEDSPANRDAVAAMINPNYMTQQAYIQAKQIETLQGIDSLCYELSTKLLQDNVSKVLE